MRAFRTPGFLKGTTLHFSVCLSLCTFAKSLLQAKKKALFEPHSASGQLCAEQATGPFSEC